jgi:hypothetical protein
VFGVLAQTQMTMTTRVSVIVTPKVSMQVFAQPLLAVATTRLQGAGAPRTFDFSHYGATAGTIAYDSLTRSYARRSRRRGAAPGSPSTTPTSTSSRCGSTPVFRWEMKPGSALYAVWTRQQVDQSEPGVFRAGARRARARSAPAATTFPGEDGRTGSDADAPDSPWLQPRGLPLAYDVQEGQRHDLHRIWSSALLGAAA